jgi:hypothetical protein
MAFNEAEEKKEVEANLPIIKKNPTGCPLKCGIRDLPAEKDTLIHHFLNFCNRMPIKCQLCDAVFTKDEFFGSCENPDDRTPEEKRLGGHWNVCKG